MTANLLRLNSAPNEAKDYAAIHDVDAIKLSFASNTIAATYSGVDLDGVLANPGPATIWLPQTFVITTSAEASCYNVTDPFVVVGLSPVGLAQTEEMTLLDTNGNETLVSLLSWSRITSVYSPAHLLGTGAIEFGVNDIVPGGAAVLKRYHAVGAGNVNHQFHSGRAAVLAYAAAQQRDFFCERILRASTTALPLQIYFDC